MRDTGVAARLTHNLSQHGVNLAWIICIEALATHRRHRHFAPRFGATSDTSRTGKHADLRLDEIPSFIGQGFRHSTRQFPEVTIFVFAWEISDLADRRIPQAFDHGPQVETATTAVAAADELPKELLQRVDVVEHAIIGTASRTTDLHTVVTSGFQVNPVDGARHMAVLTTAFARQHTNGHTAGQSRDETEVTEIAFGIEYATTAQIPTVQELYNA